MHLAPSVFMHERLLQNEYMALKACRHGAFLYNLNDSFVGQSLDRYGEWCEAELIALGQVIRPGMVVLDVGANIGTHTVFFAKAVGDQGVVYAFEPQRLAFQNLCANLALNALRRVIARQAAVGRENRTLHLDVLDPRSVLNHAATPLNPKTRGEAVEMIRLDDLELSRCDLIKIDVEGMEPEVLEGGRSLIARTHPVLFVENNTLDRSADVIEAIFSLGYDAYWQISDYFRSDNFAGDRHSVFEGVQPEANMLCFHRSRPVTILGSTRVLGKTDTWMDALERKN